MSELPRPHWEVHLRVRLGWHRLEVTSSSNPETKLLWKRPFPYAETQPDELQSECAPQWGTLVFVRAD